MTTTSNPGPCWGYAAIVFLYRWLPRPIFRCALAAGTFVGLIFMRQQRHWSREYCFALKGKIPSLIWVFHHFLTFMETLVIKLAAPGGRLPEFFFSPKAHQAAFENLCRDNRQALFGTFHVGCSDLMGCLLTDFNKRVALVRLRVGNSRDTDILESLFSGKVRFIWINQAEEFLFSLKDAIETGASIGLQCDRVEFGSKLEPFQFLGHKRLFPVTIYHLSALFRLPVVFAFPGPVSPVGRVEAYTSPVFVPLGDRRKTLAAGRIHFQTVLQSLECHLHAHPELWFNFLPLNPVARANH